MRPALLTRTTERARAFLRTPLAWILLAVLALHIVGVTWGLPASDGWDDDGIAPRDFLAGTYETFRAGHYFTYPPVHLILLSVATAPIWGAGLAHAPTLAPLDVIHEMIKVPYMTGLALVARLVTEAMAIGIVYVMARIGEELKGARAGLCVAIVCALGQPFTYYAHTTNLDVPYIFWGFLALLFLVRAIARHSPRLLRRVALFAALAVATKDQAYALFLLGAPLALAGWVVVDPWPRANLRTVVKEAAIAALVLVAVLLVADAVVFNPSGFAERVRFLVGPASQDHANYAPTWEGRASLLVRAAQSFPAFYPLPFAAFMLGGIVLALIRRQEKAKWAASLVPLLAAVSFTVAFTMVARRSEHRFLLPQSLLLALYAGLAFEALLFAPSPAVRWTSRALLGPLAAWALFGCAAVDAALLLDPRYDAEGWMRDHFAAGDAVETYGNNVYLPRFPADVDVTRVGIEPLDKRNPLPSVTEVLARFADVGRRRPRWIVVPEAWAWRYLFDVEGVKKLGMAIAPAEQERLKDLSSQIFFRDLHEGRAGYHIAHFSTWTSTFWPRVDIHASTTRDVVIFERN